MLNFLSVLSDFPASGHAFFISGKTSYDAQKFCVSLACGKTGSSDIAMMLVINFAEGKIVRSSLVNGNWTDGECDENLTSKVSNPIRRGDKFKIYILIGDGCFNVSINGEAFCNYKCKIPPKEIRAISVTGDVEAVTQMDHRLVFPTLYPLVNNDTPDVVFSGFISRKYEPGHVILISCVASGNPQGEFVIMFFENDTCRQLIHLNPRFDQQSVVINTMHSDDDSSWGDAETRAGGFPFVLNQLFKIALAFSEGDFKVAVNGQYLMSFPFDHIDLEENGLWDILTGFQIKAGSNLNVNVSQVEHIQANNRDCDGFENYSNFNAY